MSRVANAVASCEKHVALPRGVRAVQRGAMPASRAFFGGFDTRWGAQDLENRLNHPAPATQFGIVLQGNFSITTTDGETRQLRPGNVFRLEDTSPCKGHITVVGEQPGFLMFVR